MKAAFDGALATQQLLDESQMDTSQPHVTIQSTTAVDNKVEDDLKQQTLDASKKCKGGDAQECENVAHYYKELESFKHYRKYHDTYVLGVDDKGRTFVVHISNKKGSDMKDPQNNTTPAQRFEVMKEDLKSQFGEFSNLSDEQLEQVATAVSVVIEEETKKVVDVQQTTIKDASTTPVDDDFVEVAEIAARKYIHGGSDEPGIVGRGEKRKRQKNSQSDEWPNGKPSKGHEFGAWLEDGDPPISAKDWADMSTKDKIKVAQKFLGDESFHAKIYGRDENGNSKYQPPYAMAKVFIKVGEVAQGGHRELKKIRKAIQMASIKKHNPKLYAKIEKQIKGMSKKDIKNGKDKDLVAKLYAEHKEKEKWPDGPLEADSVKKSGEIKQKEADTVSKAHENVVKKVTNEDKAMGYPKVDKNGKKQNGPHTVGYIGTVMDALHFDAYIDEEDDGKMIIQMGINGAKSSHIRDCLAQKTGFTGDTKTKEGREALKLHIRNSCEIDATSGGIVIKGKDGTEDTQLMDDTWRTAGTSQKVASGYGKDMRDCVTKGVAADRNGV
jgi:hypothetical protein